MIKRDKKNCFSVKRSKNKLFSVKQDKNKNEIRKKSEKNKNSPRFEISQSH